MLLRPASFVVCCGSGGGCGCVFMSILCHGCCFCLLVCLMLLVFLLACIVNVIYLVDFAVVYVLFASWLS